MPLDITEYTDLASDARGNVVPTGLEPSRLVQQVQVGIGSVQSQPLSDVTRFVRLHSDVTCRVAFGPPGSSPVAGPESQRLVGGASEFFGVRPGSVIAVIQSN